jgi:polysaccharide biosynthesis/export protein
MIKLKRLNLNLPRIKEIVLTNFIIPIILFFCFSSSTLAENPTPPASTPPSQTTPALLSYKLAPGDVLEVSVWKEVDLQKQVIIAPDGTISLPLADTIMAAGKTISELRDIIKAKLNNYIADPAVNVALIKNDGNTIFVIGKVNKPGQFPANRHIDVLQALSLAGGLTVFANESSIHIVRRIGNEVKVFPFDYDDVMDGEKMEQNIILEPGDTVTVR